MDIREFVHCAKQVEPKLEKLNDERGCMLLREVFKQIAWEIKETTTGVVKVAGLGQFVVKQVEREKDGKKDVVKRVHFQAFSKQPPAKPKLP